MRLAVGAGHFRSGRTRADFGGNLSSVQPTGQVPNRVTLGLNHCVRTASSLASGFLWERSFSAKAWMR